MAAVTNKTGKPLSIPLPRGKTLHLGPRKSGQISAHDIDHPGLKKLVDAGAIEILAEDSGSTGGEGGGTQGRGPIPAHTAGRGGRGRGGRLEKRPPPGGEGGQGPPGES